jgi:hypothetical protein
MAKHIEFVEGPSKPKTKTWKVIAKDGNIVLGYVGWFGRWRCYTFFPEPNTVFEQTCLRDIADFMKSQTKDHRQMARERQVAKSVL